MAKAKAKEAADAQTVEQELIAITGESYKKRTESDNEYLLRILEAAVALPDAKYESLSPAADNWCREATEVANSNANTGASKALPAFPTGASKAAATDDDGEHQPETEGEDMTATATSTSKTKGKAKATKKAAAPKAEKKEAKETKPAAEAAPKKAAKAKVAKGNGAAKKEPKEPKKRAESGSHKVMVSTCKDLNASVDVIINRTKASGVAESQVRNIFRLTHSVIDAAREAGLVK